jgi:PAS domain S-box-containing protein
LDALVPVLATNLEILDRVNKTKELLTATQAQAERMEKQAAQLEEQAVEMEAQQAELLETENWFRGIIQTSPDGMMVIDEQGRILLANPRIEEIFGLSISDLMTMNVDDLVPDSVRPDHPHLRQKFLDAGQNRAVGRGIMLTAKRKDGREIPVQVALSILPDRGTYGRCVCAYVRTPTVE